MVDFTSFQTLAKVLNDLTPHIEERAVRYSLYATVMSARVLTLSDMRGSWNVRKVSEYFRPSRAKKLSEGTNIPDQTLYRARLNTAAPDEWGDSYPISERRLGTDLENILSETVITLGSSLGMRREKLLMKEILAMANANNTYDQSANAYAMTYQIPMQQQFSKLGLAGTGELFHVIHPYQVIPVKQDLVDLTKAAVPQFRNELISSWDVGGFGNLNVAESGTVPRFVVYKLDFGTVTGGTFKLRIGELATGAEAITANITFSGTIATLLTNIETAVNALGLGTWDATGTVVTDVTLTPPANYYVDAEDELRVPFTSDDNGAKVYDSALTGGDRTYPSIVERVGSKAIAPMFFRDAVLLDIRKPFTYNSAFVPKARVIESYASETYAVANWRDDHVLFIKTKAESPFAVA